MVNVGKLSKQWFYIQINMYLLAVLLSKLFVNIDFFLVGYHDQITVVHHLEVQTAL